MKAGYLAALLCLCIVAVTVRAQDEATPDDEQERTMMDRLSIVAGLARQFVAEIADQMKRLAKSTQKTAKIYYAELKKLSDIRDSGNREEFREALKEFLLKIKYDLITLNWPNLYLQLLKFWLGYIDDVHIEQMVDKLAEYDIVKRNMESNFF